jgi:hypothetical protein
MMGGFNFDFSGLNPWIQGMTGRAFTAMDERAARQPYLDAQADRAYREWLENNKQKRDLAMQAGERDARGFHAAEALQKRRLQEEVNAKSEALMEKRAAFLATTNRYSNFMPGATQGGNRGSVADFYQYGPYAYGGRGGGGNAPAPNASTGEAQRTVSRGELWGDTTFHDRNCAQNPTGPGCPQAIRSGGSGRSGGKR